MKTRAAQVLDKLGISYEIREFHSVSAGMRGMQLFLQPQDLVRATRATLAAIGAGSED